MSCKGRWCFVGDEELKNRIGENDMERQAKEQNAINVRRTEGGRKKAIMTSSQNESYSREDWKKDSSQDLHQFQKQKEELTVEC